MLALLLEVAAHVPTYGAGTCQTPPHIHTTSQVIYLKSTGGLEIHFSSLTSPFNITGNEVRTTALTQITSLSHSSKCF